LKLSFLRRAAGQPKGRPARRLPLRVEGLEDIKASGLYPNIK